VKVEVTSERELEIAKELHACFASMVMARVAELGLSKDDRLAIFKTVYDDAAVKYNFGAMPRPKTKPVLRLVPQASAR
jgi:hypothetical protein